MSGNRKKTERKHSKVSKHDDQELCRAEEKQAIISMPHSDKHPDPQPVIVEIDDQPKIWSKREWKYVQHVIKCCEGEDGFDIYQLMAFDSDTKHGKKDCIKYMFNIIKSILWYDNLKLHRAEYYLIFKYHFRPFVSV